MVNNRTACGAPSRVREEPLGCHLLLLWDQAFGQMICIERVAVDAEPVRAFPEAWQSAQPLDRGLGLSLGRIDPDELDLVPVVVVLIFVMNHKDCRKRLVQSPSPVRPKPMFPSLAAMS